MNPAAVATPAPIAAATGTEKPTRVRYGVLAFACSLSMITYLDRVCFGSVVGYIQNEFGLSDDQKGWLFFAFGLAYAAFEIPSGWLGDMFGARKTLIRIVLWWSVFTALTGTLYPNADWPLLLFGILFLIRFFFGMGEAGAYPNIARAFHNWFPFEERGLAKGAVWMAGRFAGGITPLIVFALLYETHADNGAKVVHWRHMFWIFGIIGCVWCVFFAWWFRDRPEDKAGVNQAELAFIHGLPPGQESKTVGDAASVAHGVKAKVPWAKLVKDRNLWFLCVMYFMGSYGWYFNITYLPNYLKEHFPGQIGYTEKWTWDFWRTSLMTGMPLLVGSVACLIGGLLTDFFIRVTGNRKWGRRLFGVVGKGLCSVCFFCCIFTDSAWGLVLAVSLGAFFNDLTMGAAWASCLDIGGKYSGIVAGCMNSVGNLGAALAGILTARIVTVVTYQSSGLVRGDPGFLQASQLGWTCNFIVYASFYFVAMMLWFWFDSTKQVAQE